MNHQPSGSLCLGLHRLAQHEHDSMVFGFVAVKAIPFWESGKEIISRLAQVFRVLTVDLIWKMGVSSNFIRFLLFILFLVLRGVIARVGGCAFAFDPFPLFQNQGMIARLVAGKGDDRPVLIVRPDLHSEFQPRRRAFMFTVHEITLMRATVGSHRQRDL